MFVIKNRILGSQTVFKGRVLENNLKINVGLITMAIDNYLILKHYLWFLNNVVIFNFFDENFLWRLISWFAIF